MTDIALVEKIKSIALYTTVMVPIEFMRESEYNPNELVDDEELIALKRSISANKEFFQARPILLNSAGGREGVIIGGAKRYRAAKELGWMKAPAMFVIADTLEKEKAWNLLDNNHNGQLNAMKRQQIFMDLHEVGYDMSSLGHTGQEVSEIMTGIDGLGESGGEDGAGSIPAKGWIECPECGHKAPKKEFKKVEIDEVSEEKAKLL